MWGGFPRLPDRRRALILVSPLAAGLALFLAAAGYSAQQQPTPAMPDLASLNDLAPLPGVLIYVSGAVAHPGLYRLNRGDRVYAALAAAGGLISGADPYRLPDLAGRLKDGEQVKVPYIGTTGGGSSGRPARLDLNSATAEELAALPGFSPELASAVLAYRSGYGGFSATRELVTILGMGESDYALAKPYLKV